MRTGGTTNSDKWLLKDMMMLLTIVSKGVNRCNSYTSSKLHGYNMFYC